MDATELQQLEVAIADEILAGLRPPRLSELGCPGAERVSSCAQVARIDPVIAGLINYTLLRPEATRDDIRKLCCEARQYCFASVEMVEAAT